MSALRLSVMGLKEAARRAAAGAPAAAAAGHGISHMAIHATTMAAEVLEHGAPLMRGHTPGLPSLPPGGWVGFREAARSGGRRLVGNARATSRAVSSSSEVGAGILHGALAGPARVSVKGARLGAEMVGNFARKGFHMDAEHGFGMTDWAGKRLALGAAAVGVAGTMGTLPGAVQSQYDRDPDDPSLHREAMGASGHLVTAGARKARKRY
jgi:hypothetical protein